jgi:Ca-activated chloride channel family protein
MQPVVIDEATLKGIAEKTGGHYFRARDNQALAAIYRRSTRWRSPT